MTFATGVRQSPCVVTSTFRVVVPVETKDLKSYGIRMIEAAEGGP